MGKKNQDEDGVISESKANEIAQSLKRKSQESARIQERPQKPKSIEELSIYSVITLPQRKLREMFHVRSDRLSSRSPFPSRKERVGQQESSGWGAGFFSGLILAALVGLCYLLFFANS
ncbi:MAG: hypothetical protein EA369_08555 [Bradymonadales bacterium]|nr:MAG: hypothetical protein EA369_08555 [Bradymonadales bacterium]